MFVFVCMLVLTVFVCIVRDGLRDVVWLVCYVLFRVCDCVCGCLCLTCL